LPVEPGFIIIKVGRNSLSEARNIPSLSLSLSLSLLFFPLQNHFLVNFPRSQ
jgi:hypothetical protein